MIDIRTENLIPLTKAPRLENLPLRRYDKPPHVATFFRWARRGLRGVRLETIRVGGTLCTTAEALQRFFEALSRTERPATQARQDVPGKRASRAAEQLDNLGF